MSETITALAERDGETAALAMIERAARDPQVDVAKLERLVALRNQERALIAEQHFNVAMQAVQGASLRIVRDAVNSHSSSRYARLESINKVLVPIYTQHGFSLSFGTADCPVAGHYRIVCKVSHASGHSRDYQCDLPSDLTGPKGLPNKAPIQGFGSTMSYGRRYLELLIFNISLVNEDDDGQSTANQKPKGPNSLMSDKAAPDAPATVALKKQLVDLTRSISLLPKGYKLGEAEMARINQYCWDENFISDTETIDGLTHQRLDEVVSAITKRLRA